MNWLSVIARHAVTGKNGLETFDPLPLMKPEGRLSAVLLEDVTESFSVIKPQLGRAGNKLTEDNIDKLIANLKDLLPATYGKQAEDIWDRLVLPQKC